MFTYIKKLTGALLLNIFLISACYADQPPLIPRAIIFGNPAKVNVQISPDAKWYSYLAPSPSGVLNIWIQDIRLSHAPIMLSNDSQRGIHNYGWALDNKHILYYQDKFGDENFHLYSLTIDDKAVQDLTPYPNVKASGFYLNKDYPQEILLNLNLRDAKIFDVYRINLNTGKSTFDTKNPGNVTSWLADKNFQIRAAMTANDEDGSSALQVRNAASSPWHTLITWPFGEEGNAIIFSKDGKNLTIVSNKHSDTSQLEVINVQTGKLLQVLASNPLSDIANLLVDDQNTYRVQAVQFDYLKPEWVVLDPAIKADFDRLKQAKKGEFQITSRDLSNQHWIVAFYSDTLPSNYYVYNRGSKKLTFLFAARPELQKYQLASMQPVVISARDGMKLVSYLTIPPGKKPNKLPLILNVHGGPWLRDTWGYDSEAQWLANRGYAVLQVNFRGSDGFGKKFLNAGNGQWGVGSMQHDLTDAVNWAIHQGIADPKKICIYGGSYGGYATLAGLAFTPQLYACGIDVVGPSDLQALLASVPPYWLVGIKQMKLRIGSVDTNDAFNKKVSPLFHAENIRSPLLIAQGANDPRVNINQSNSIVKTLRDNHIDVEYIVYMDEGHRLVRPENRMDFYGRMEEFLAKYLGQRMQKFEAIQGSSAKAS